jgi:nitrate reductase gamma subunit
MEQNPFSPPKSSIVNLPEAGRVHPPKYLIIATVALFAVHMATFANYSGYFWELVSVGAMRPVGLLSGFAADMILLLGIILLFFRRYIKCIFLAAAAGLFFTCALMLKEPVGQISVLITYGSGAAVALLGLLTAFRHKLQVV